jgi:single-strand DNA-binding protein
MARSVNKIILLGNVGKDPEFRATAGGTSVANFSLATTDRTKDQAGNWTDRTEWHNLVAFQRTAEIVRDYVKKGSKLYIEGKIQTRSWDDKTSGEKKYRTEVLINELVLLSGKSESGSEAGYSRGGGSSYDQRSSGPSDDLVSSTEITDDDIPF